MDRERVVLDFAKSGWPNLVVLGKYHYKYTRKHLAPHAHRQMMEICFCSKGEQRYEVNGNYYKLRGGDFFVTYPGEWHGTGIYGEEKGELYWMIIRIPQRRTNTFLYFDEQVSKSWIQSLLQLQRHFRGNKLVKPKLEKIFRVFDTRRKPSNKMVLQHAVADFLMEAIQCSQQTSVTRSTSRVEKINRYIDEQMDEPASLQQLALICELSLSRFKAWFREETGSTPLDYVLRRKMEYAKSRLKEMHAKTRSQKSPVTIADIAYETGFQSSQYFSAVFKKFVGTTPGQFRDKKSQ